MDKHTLWTRRLFVVMTFIVGYLAMIVGEYDKGAFWLTFANFTLLLRLDTRKTQSSKESETCRKN